MADPPTTHGRTHHQSAAGAPGSNGERHRHAHKGQSGRPGGSYGRAGDEGGRAAPLVPVRGCR